MKKRVGAVEAMRRRKLILIAYGLLTPLIILGFGPQASATQKSGDIIRAANDHLTSISSFPRWTSMLQRHYSERGAVETSCDKAFFARCHLTDWMNFLGTLGQESPEIQLERVNRFMNRAPYVRDQHNYLKADYWATPRQFMSQFGDCEDYAIAKFFSLRALGWKNEDLRIVVVETPPSGRRHAVLVAFADGEAWVLDNQSDQVTPWSSVGKFKPIYAVNEFQAWLYRD